MPPHTLLRKINSASVDCRRTQSSGEVKHFFHTLDSTTLIGGLAGVQPPSWKQTPLAKATGQFMTHYLALDKLCRLCSWTAAWWQLPNLVMVKPLPSAPPEALWPPPPRTRKPNQRSTEPASGSGSGVAAPSSSALAGRRCGA